MSTLQQMIDQLCPNGVEHVRLGDVTKIKTGQSISKNRIAENPGPFPVINSGKEPLGYTNISNSEDPIGITTRGAGVGFVSWTPTPHFKGNLNYNVHVSNEKVNVRYLYFSLTHASNAIHELCSYAGIPALNLSRITTLELPLPPREVQDKIVDYLDALVAVCDNLDTEIAQREHQFEAYRNKLITSATGDEVKLGDLLAYEQPSKYLVKQADYDDRFEVPVLTAGKTFILGYTEETDGVYQASYESPVVIFDDFTTAHKWVDFPFKAKSSAMKMLTPSTDTNSFKFIFYSLANIDVDTTDHKRQWISTVSNEMISLPPLSVQEDIADKLDTMQALIDNLKHERELRGQQFDFYRTKLLTFVAKDSTTND